MKLFGVLLAMLTCLQPTEVPLTKVDPPQPASQAITPFEFAQGIRHFYRSGRLHERYDIVVSEEGGDRIRTEVKLRSVVTTDGPRMIVDFGPFSAMVESSRLAIVHRHNRKSVLKVEGEPAIDLISGVMPPLPIPQIPFMLQTGSKEESNAIELESLGNWFRLLQIVEVETKDGGFLALCESLRGNRATIRTDRTFRIVQCSAEIDNRGARGTFEMNVFELPPADIESWDHFVSDREIVSDITSLIALPSFVHVGDRLPELGLLDDELQPWSLDVIFERGIASAPASRQFVAIILYDAASDAALSDAVSAVGVIQDLARQLRRAAAIGDGPMIRLTPIAAGTIGRRTISTDDIAFERKRWPQGADSELLDVDTSFAWAPPFSDPIRRFHPDAQCTIVIVDGQKRVEAILPVSGDRESIIQSLNEVVK